MFDAVVIGGGPAGATAAEDLARSGHRVAMLDRSGRIETPNGRGRDEAAVDLAFAVGTDRRLYIVDISLPDRPETPATHSANGRQGTYRWQ